jgi:Putative transposase
LLFHPHLHCVVPGGGISLDGTRWISCRPRFFLPVRVLSRLFRRLFLTYLEEAFDSGRLRFFSSLEALRDRQAFNRHLDPVRNSEWVVYAKPPFAGPQQVVDYVGRYTHRVAISNHRIVDIEGGEVKKRSPQCGAIQEWATRFAALGVSHGECYCSLPTSGKAEVRQSMSICDLARPFPTPLGRRSLQPCEPPSSARGGTWEMPWTSCPSAQLRPPTGRCRA